MLSSRSSLPALSYIEERTTLDLTSYRFDQSLFYQAGVFIGEIKSQDELVETLIIHAQALYEVY